MLVCLLLRELRDAPNIRMSPIVSELSDTPPLTWLCHAIMSVYFCLISRWLTLPLRPLSGCVCIVIFQWEIKTNAAQTGVKAWNVEGLEGRRADNAATCSEGNEHLRVTAEGKETTRMVRKEQVKKKREDVKEKGKISKQKFNKADRFCKWEKTDAFRATCVPRGKVKQGKARAYSIALCKNPNLPSTLCFF